MKFAPMLRAAIAILTAATPASGTISPSAHSRVHPEGGVLGYDEGHRQGGGFVSHQCRRARKTLQLTGIC
jgi:hypothetical protein